MALHYTLSVAPGPAADCNLPCPTSSHVRAAPDTPAVALVAPCCCSLEVALNSIAFLRFCASRLAEGSIGDLPEGVPALEPEKISATRLVRQSGLVALAHDLCWGICVAGLVGLGRCTTGTLHAAALLAGGGGGGEGAWLPCH